MALLRDGVDFSLTHVLLPNVPLPEGVDFQQRLFEYLDACCEALQKRIVAQAINSTCRQGFSSRDAAELNAIMTLQFISELKTAIETAS